MKKSRRDRPVLIKNRRWKMCMIATFTCFLSVFLVFSSYAETFSQQKVSMNLGKTTIKKALTEFQRQNHTVVLYSDDSFEADRSVTANFEEVDVEQFLTTLLEESGMTYKMMSDYILIVPKKGQNEVAQVSNEMVTIKGVVKDAQGGALPGVTILLKGTTLGRATENDGTFSLTVPKQDNIVLVFSCMGMKSVEVKYTNQKSINVTMEEDDAELEEVVVTGLFDARKESYTGTVVKVEGKELLQVANRNIISAIQVFDPSFRIMENNEMGSNPNAIPEFYIRGQSGIGNLATADISESQLRSNPNLPLFIMDGLEISVETLYDMDPNRIASITLLKDAAATAIYGSKASNGVVVIETVAPEAGKFHISYRLTGTITAPDLSSYDYMNSEEKLAAESAAGFYTPDGNSIPVRDGVSIGGQSLGNDMTQKLREYWSRQLAVDNGVYTDWMSIPLRVGYNHKHSLSIDGGNDNIRYGISLGFDNQNGVMKKDFRRNFYTNLRVDYRLSNLVVINRISFNRTASKNSPYGSFSEFVKMLPFNTPYDADGNVVKNLQYGATNSTSLKNPIWEGEMTQNFNGGTSKTITENLQVNYYANEHLRVSAQLGLTLSQRNNRNFVDPNSGTFATTDGTGTLSKTTSESFNMTTNLMLHYNNSFCDGANMVTASVGMSTSHNKGEATSIRYKGFPSGNLSDPMFAQEVVGNPTEEDNVSRTIGWIGRVNFSHKDIYLLDASFRLDGSSEFGRNQTYAPFFSIGGGLNLHNYSFLKGNDIISYFKMTATYGRTGSQNFAPYASRYTYKIQTEDWFKTGMSVNLMGIGNPDLKWQIEDSYNFGLQTSFLKNLIRVNFGYYREMTKDMVSNVTIPSSVGFTTFYDNVGKMKNEGYDISVHLQLVKRKDLFVSAFANTNHNKNTIQEISNSLRTYNEEVEQYYSQVGKLDDVKLQQRFEEGASTTAIWGMKSLGINPTNGKEVFVRRDGTITYNYEPSEQQVLGDKLSKMKGTFGFNAQWRKWSVFASFMYEWGGKAYNTTLPNRVETVDLYNQNADNRVSSMRWQEFGDISPMKSIKDRLAKTYPSSRFVQKNNFVEFNSLSLSWTENKGWVQRWGLSQVQFSVNTNDLAHWSTIKRERGTDYPFAWNVDFTLAVSF